MCIRDRDGAFLANHQSPCSCIHGYPTPQIPHSLCLRKHFTIFAENAPPQLQQNRAVYFRCRSNYFRSILFTVQPLLAHAVPLGIHGAGGQHLLHPQLQCLNGDGNALQFLLDKNEIRQLILPDHTVCRDLDQALFALVQMCIRDSSSTFRVFPWWRE